ncbi:hypothetical protein BX600DRAFT_512571 [Xylariales sp. PMI_506]|nr:hypothetical protein BX600DRAFT_512571 [Xylariales sp. PMI_506]
MAARDAYYPVILTFAILNTTALFLRFWARIKINGFGLDDGFLAASYVGFVLFGALELSAIHYGIGATVWETQFDPVKAAMFFTIAQVVYIATAGLSKLGVAMVLLRLANGSDMPAVRLVLIVSMSIFTLVSFSAALVYGLQCRPISVAWGLGEGTCLSTMVLGGVGIGLSAADVAASWVYALLPVWMLRKAQLNRRLKASIMILLGLGAVSSVATIIRLNFVIQVLKLSTSQGLASPEVLQKTLEGTVYSIIEIGLSILAASLIALRPLLKNLSSIFNTSDHGSSIPLQSIHNFQQGSGSKTCPYRLADGDDDGQDTGSEVAIFKRTVIEQNWGDQASTSRLDRGKW